MWLLRAACECLAAFDKRAVLYLAAAVSDFYIPSDKMVIIHVMLITKLHDYGYFVIQHDLCDFLFSTFISQRTKYNLDTEPQRFPYNLCQKCWLHWSVYGFQMHSLFHSSWKPTRICWSSNHVIVWTSTNTRWVTLNTFNLISFSCERFFSLTDLTITWTISFFQLVIANMLQTRKSRVIFVTPTSSYEINMKKDQLLAGMEIEEHIVADVVCSKVSSSNILQHRVSILWF